MGSWKLCSGNLSGVYRFCLRRPMFSRIPAGPELQGLWVQLS